MRANLAQREPEFLKFWDEIDIYQKLRQHCEGREKWVLHDGPPYANGALHIGHAVNKILKDIIVKSKTLSGYDSPYVPGWDCHGLPIEHEVEKKLGREAYRKNPSGFRRACREFATKQIDIQRQGFIRMGVIGDWFDPYLTMKFETEANTVRALARIYENGHMMHDLMTVYWCADCASALAEAEVEYFDKISQAVDVRMQSADTKSVQEAFEVSTNDQTPIYCVVWTTTPWTLPANRAVAVHAELQYSLIRIGSDTLNNECLIIVASELAESCLERYGFENWSKVAETNGQQLVGLQFGHPIEGMDLVVPMISSEHVTLEAGTGLVHTAPGHGHEDFALGKKYGLEIYNPVGPNGCFFQDVPNVGGLSINEGGNTIIDLLKVRGDLVATEEIEHSYAHCWRHKSPILYRATPQWFISMDRTGLRTQALEAVKEVQWVPTWGEARIDGMVRNRPDWCLSRQRVWGTPIAIFTHKETGEPHPQTLQIFEKVAEQIEAGGIDAWFDSDAAEFIGEDAQYYNKVSDVLDVWFDSGATHYSVLNNAKHLTNPAGMYLEGSDQHRGWFQSSLLVSTAITGKPPYQSVLTHGFTVDGDGRKMSKSVGNIIGPQEIIDSLGADVLRLWVASTEYEAEMGISNLILTRTTDLYRRIRNTARFLVGNLEGFDPSMCVDWDDMVEIDQWAIHTSMHLQDQIVDAYEQYRFHLICQKIHRFCVVEMGGFYLDVLKDRLYTMPHDSVERRSAQTAMYHILQALVRWLAPILSFTAEEIWRYVAGTKEPSVLLATWYDDWPEKSKDNEAVDSEFWSQVIAMRDEVNRVLEVKRNEGSIGSSLAADVTLYCSDQLYKKLNEIADEVKFLTITSSATIKPLNETQQSSNGEINLPLVVEVNKSDNTKCVRCWHQTPDVGSIADHPEICARCFENIEGAGEKRRFA